MWIEELGEFKTEDEVTTITNSMLRGELDEGLFYKFYFSYNPAKRKQHWANKRNMKRHSNQIIPLYITQLT